MALSIWTERSGYRFNTIQERTIINQDLPVSYANGFQDSTNLTFTVISGRLPNGLRIVEDKITGTAAEVPRSTDYEFVVRAKYGEQIADRTFFLTVEGADVPIWQTAAGSLAVLNTDQYYVLDSTYIDFQLVATDFDTSAGQSLKYFKKLGELPPGLILTETGRIVGWIQPALGIPETAGNGAYDTTIYDDVAYDFGYQPESGYDSFINYTPNKINRYYEFIVVVTDGDTSVERTFKIYVIGDDYFRADNISFYAGVGAYTVDTTYVRSPIWETASDLGTKRANNYQTFKLDVYTGIELGPITYELENVNPKITGRASTTLSTENKITRNLIRIKDASGTPTTGKKITLKNYVDGADSTIYTITNVSTVSSTEFVLTVTPVLAKAIPNDTWIALGTTSEIPPGMQFDPGSSEVFGVLPYQPAITKSYEFTILATRYSDKLERANSRRTFGVQIIGEIDSIITWITPASLGTIQANLISTLSLSAETTLANAVILYVKTLGALPPGLTLNLDGEIVGKVRQFGTQTEPGIITFDNNNFTLDFNETTFDKEYTFTVEARDITNYSTVSRTFTLAIDTPNDRLYSNLTVKPFLKQNQRDLFRSFITDNNVFTINSIYRPSDANFGIQTDLRMLVFAGIETKSASQTVSVINRNHKEKRFKLGDIKKAKAKITGTNDVVYEVIYIDVIDPLEVGKKYLPSMINTSPSQRAITTDQNNQYYNGPFDLDTKYWNAPDPFSATVDRSDVFPEDPYSAYKFPSSVSIWRKRIKELGLKERNYLPLWMRTIQDGEVQELDYVKAIPLCYCKPGMADDVLLNIKNRNFDFSQIDYVIDRYIIDSVTGYSADKYIVFRNDRTTIT